MLMSFHYTVETNKSVDEAVAAIEESLKEVKFGVLWNFNITETLKSKGFSGVESAYRVLEVCNPGEAENVLTKNPLVSYFLPCKIVVYEDGGKTKMGLPRPTALMGILEDESLMETAERIEQVLISALDNSK